MAGISLLLGASVLALPVEQTMVWALFYSTLFWLPVRGVAAAIDRCRDHRHMFVELDEEAAPQPCYHIGMKVLPPF
jgi:hypothetical protein